MNLPAAGVAIREQRFASERNCLWIDASLADNQN